MRWRRIIVLIGLIAVGIGIALGLWWQREIDRFDRQAAYYNCLYNSTHDFAVQLNTHIDHTPLRMNTYRDPMGDGVSQLSPDGIFWLNEYQRPNEAPTVFIDNLATNTRIILDNQQKKWQWSPDYHFIYNYHWLDEDHTIQQTQILTLDGALLYEQVIHNDKPSPFLFSADDQHFVFPPVVEADGQITVTVISTNDFQAQTFSWDLPDFIPGANYGAIWLADSHFLAVGTYEEAQFAIIDVDQNRILHSELTVGRIWWVYLTRDGNYVYGYSNQDDTYLIRVFSLLDDDLPLVAEKVESRSILDAKYWTPDSLLYTGAGGDEINYGALWRINLTTGQDEPLPIPPYVEAIPLLNGRFVIVRQQEQTELVEIWDAAGTRLATLLSEPIDTTRGYLSCMMPSANDKYFFCYFTANATSHRYWYLASGKLMFEGDAVTYEDVYRDKFRVFVYRNHTGAHVDIIDQDTGAVYPLFDARHDIEGITHNLMDKPYFHPAPFEVVTTPAHWFILFERGLYRYSPIDGSVELLYSNVNSMSLSPDSKRLAIYMSITDLSRHDDIVVLELDGSKQWNLGRFHTDSVPGEWTQCGGVLAKWRDDRAAIRLN